MAALDTLPSKLRAVMVLRCVEDMSYAEIARQLRCKLGTVKSRLHSARKNIIEFLSAKELLPESMKSRGMEK